MVHIRVIMVLYVDLPCTSVKGLMVSIIDGIWGLLKGIYDGFVRIQK